MQLLQTSAELAGFPWDGPSTLTQAQLEALPVYVAIVAEGSAEPQTSDYTAATWVNHQVTFLVSGLADGIYTVYGRIVNAATSEDVRKVAGRMRIGDPRT